MKYQQWDKKSDISGKTALELIGEEQMKNSDPFIIFTDDTGKFLSLESVDTLKAIYNFKGATVAEIAAEYIQYKKNEKPIPTSEEQLKVLQEKVDLANKAIDSLIMGV